MRKLLLTLLVLVATTTALAQEIQVVGGGQRHNYAVDQLSRLEFADDGINVVRSDEQGDLYLFASDLQQILFHPTTTAVEKVADRAMTLLVARNGDLLTINGWTGEATDVDIFDINGRRVLQRHGWTSGDIDISALTPGVYVIRVGHSSTKFIK